MGRPGAESEHPGPATPCAHSTCTLQGSPGPHRQGPRQRLGPRTGQTKEGKVTTPPTLGGKLPGGGGPRDGHDPGASPRLSLALRPSRPASAAAAPPSGGPRPPPAPHTPLHSTCGEPRLGWGLLDGHGEGGGRGGGLRPGQGPVPAEGHRDAGGLHGRLVVPQLVDPLLLQEEGLLGAEERGRFVASRRLPSPAAGLRVPSLPDPPPHRPWAPSAEPYARLLGRSLPSGPGGQPVRQRPWTLPKDESGHPRGETDRQWKSLLRADGGPWRAP